MQQQIRDILVEIGEDPEREGLLDTPKRVEKSLKFLTRGYRQTLEEVVNGALFEAESDDMVIVRDIEFFSMCEHHMLPFFGKCHVGYIPKGKMMEARNLCMEMRVVEKQHSVMNTSSMVGSFRRELATRNEFTRLIR